VDVPILGARPGGPVALPVAPIAVPGLSTCLEESRLVCDGRPVVPSPDAIDALRLAEHALARGRSVLFCPPDPAAPLAALVAAAVHVADIADAYRSGGLAVGSSRRVAVVTTDYRMRGLYRGVAVRHPGGGSAPIRQVFPAAALGASGAVNILDEAGRGWSTVFANTVADVTRVAPVDLVVLDLPCADARRAAALNVPVVAVARDPADPAAVEMASRWPAFGWEQHLPARVEIAPVPSEMVCVNAGLFWSDVAGLARAGSSGLIGAEIAREAFALFHDLLGAALPLSVLDRHTASPVAARLAGLRRAARLAEGELADLYVPMVEVELSALAEAVAADGAKADALPRLLAAAVDDRLDVLLLARTAPLARAYQDHLARVGLGMVRVASLAAAAAEPPADLAVLTGMAPRWARWAYRGRSGAAIRVLAYTGRGTFDEAALVATSARAQAAAAAALSSSDRRARSWALLSGAPVPAPVGTDPAWPDPIAAADVPPPPEAPPGLWDRGRWTVDLEPSASTYAGRDSAVDRVVPGLRVRFDDGSWSVLAADDVVARWQPVSARLDQVVASSLQIGDRLVFLDADAHKTLLGKVLEVSDGVPELAAAGAWLDVWRQALLRGYRAAGGYSQFARQINLARTADGCRPLDPVTIRFWVTGHTIGPDDAVDVRRVGQVVGDAVLLGAHDQVHRAMRTLRSAHVQLRQRLADLALRLGPAATAGALPADELLDERSGLTAADVETAVSLAIIADINAIGDVPAVVTGRRHSAQESL
jgi:hypothetical protein